MMRSARAGTKKPSKHLVIGIDVGMTFTGVAHFASTDSKPTVLQDEWPGANDSHKKVPTILVYNKDPEPASNSKRNSFIHYNHGHSSKRQSLSSWGFIALDDDERYSPDKETCECFKLGFDEEWLEDRISKGFPAGFTHQDVCRYYKDYLSKLYAHLQDYYSGTWPDLWEGRVHFVFSVPTTWKNQKTVSELKEIALSVGFGTRPNHCLEISLTEAHAAAVATAYEQGEMFKKNQVILVCDAGGGTTDVALLRVNNSAGSPLKLSSLDSVCGEAVGSTRIDRDFRLIVEERLEGINQDCVNDGLEEPIKNVFLTAEMISAHPTFIMHKRKLCPNDIETNAEFRMSVKDVSRFPNEDLARELGFKDGKFCFYPTDLAQLFDKQIQVICQILDEQFKYAAQKNITIDHLILSGGLGSSKYVYAELEKRYCNLRDEDVDNDNGGAVGSAGSIPNLRILRAAEPQLVVCRGLVIDKMADLKGDNRPIDTWIARQSYGFVGIRKFDKYRDNESDIILDGGVLDKTGDKFVEQIHWIVHKNERLRVSSEKSIPVRRRFDDLQQARKTQWKSMFVVSDREPKPDQRPQRPNRQEEGYQRLCVLKSNLSDITVDDLDVRSGGFLGSKKKKHYIAYYEIWLKVGPADIDFELRFNGEPKSYPGDIEIDWERDRVGDELSPETLSERLRRSTKLR